MIGVNQVPWIVACGVEGSILEHLNLHLESQMEVMAGNKRGRNIRRL